MKIFLFALSTAVMYCGGLQAAEFTDVADVISSTPIHERVSQPYLDCWTETTTVPPKGASLGGEVLGGVTGALIGSQIGDGTGKKIATVVGAIAGVKVADRSANSKLTQTQQVEHCREVKASDDVITGYKVIYRYKDQDITTVLPYSPSEKIRIGIRVIEDVR
ncbi:MAG: glycine zipper 2TM domain-containing protein [Gallionella sp.]|nr:glycine zipper 2TM domain-containing protein [Gallionella sp.]